MYYIKYTDEFLNDVYIILDYINHILDKEKNAFELLYKIKKEIGIIIEYPYSIAEYQITKKLKYRISKVGNYGIFYKIDEDNKIITIIRFISFKRNTEKLLNNNRIV